MKKGFTLIELLAVIVILAIIALIAFPTISGLVEKSKKGGVEQSANGYNDAINKQMALNLMDSNDENDINKGIIDAPFDSKYNLKVKGQTPKKGWAEVLKDGVYRYSYVIGEYVVSYDGVDKTVIKGTEPNPKPSFATDSWEVIINNVRNGNADVYNLGDAKEIDMGEFGTHTVRISNMSTPSECSTDGFSQTACGFVLEFSDIITIHNISDSDTYAGGWGESEIRKFVNNDIYNSLPDDLRDGIINSNVVWRRQHNEKHLVSTDKIYLLTAKELYNSDQYVMELETRQLDYYKLSGITYKKYCPTNHCIGAKRLKSDSTCSGFQCDREWWLRDFDVFGYGTKNEKISYNIVNSIGLNNRSDTPSKASGVSPAFRIG